MLELGEYCGRTAFKRTVGRFVLTQTEYPAGTVIPRHAHERGYICLIRAGSYKEWFDRSERRCDPLLVSYHPPREVHAEEMLGEAVSSFNVEVDAEWLGLNGAPVSGVTGFPGARSAWLAARLYQRAASGEPMSASAVESMVRELLVELCCVEPVRDPRPSWLDAVCDHIDDQLDRPLRLAELGRVAAVHPVYLASQFRRRIGCTVGEYTRRQRLHRATVELVRSVAPLAEVGLRAGFYDQAHFGRTFKRYTGLTPASFRALFRAT